MKNSVRVWNRNRFDHVEMFKGELVTIPAESCIEMDYDEAVLFKGKFFAPKFGKDGVQDPRSYKWIELDMEDVRAIKEDRARSLENDSSSEKVFVCQACAKEFRTKNGLLKHVKDKHQSAMVDKEARDELLDNEDLE